MTGPSPSTRRLPHTARAAGVKAKRWIKQQLQRLFDAWILHPHHDTIIMYACILVLVAALFSAGAGVGKAAIALINLVHSMPPGHISEMVAVVICLGLAGTVATVLVGWVFWRTFRSTLWSVEPPSIEAFDPQRAQSSGDSLFVQRCHTLVAANSFLGLTPWEWALAHWLWNMDSPGERNTFLDAVLPVVESTGTSQRRF